MENKILLILILFGIISTIFPQQSFRSAVLLTHSSGSRLYDYDAYMGTDSTDISVPLEIDDYNATNNYTGTYEVNMVKRWFPDPLGTDWYNWLGTIRGEIPGTNNNFWAKLDTFNVVIIKGGIQTTQMTGYGSPDDTIGTSRSNKTIETYKWILRELVEAFEDHPEKFFSIMTGAACPERFQTTNGARLSHEFATWIKDTLATGNDPVFGNFPSNVYIFDYFHYLADEDGNLKAEYEIPAPADDFHQNATACDVIAPIFVQEVFDAAITYETIIPVELTSFSASLVSAGVKLNWSTATELNNDGFEIQKKIDNGNFFVIGFVKGQGTSTHRNEYSFIDKNTDPGKYLYRLKQIDFDGSYSYSHIVDIDFEPITTYVLEQNYPNPFNPSTKIEFSIPEDVSIVTLTIFNALGQKVAELVNSKLEADKYSYVWNASNVSTGLYIYELRTDKFVFVKKMMLLK